MSISEDPANDWLSRPRTIIGGWAAYAFLSINQSYVWAVVAARDRAWYEPVGFALATAVVWASLTPFIIRLARRKRIDRFTWRRNLPWHVLAVLCAGLADAAGDQVARAIAGLPPAFWADYFRKLDIITFYYAIVSGLAHAVDYYGLYRRGELRAARLQSELRASQLELLKSQLQPHFLFNTMNAVNALIYEDPRAADRVVTRLAELLRMTLALGARQEITLAHELAFVRAYLDIQKTRMGDRLTVVIDVASELEDAVVPSLLLQPLVENAVIHGIAPLVRGGRVRISAARDADQLVLRVIDNGAGFKRPVRYGVGVSNVQQRLEQLYGNEQTFSIGADSPTGTHVEIRLPLHFSNESVDATAAVIDVPARKHA